MNFSAHFLIMLSHLVVFIVKWTRPSIAKFLVRLLGYSEFRVWLDDKRAVPPEFNIVVRSAMDAVFLLNTHMVTRISLDHDLGPVDRFGDGYMVAIHIEQGAYFGHLEHIDVMIHTDNAARRPYMKMAIDNAMRYWKDRA